MCYKNRLGSLMLILYITLDQNEEINTDSILLKYRFYSDFTSFFTNTLFLFQAQIQDIMLCLIVLSPCCHSVAKSCPTLCDPMDCGTPGLPVPHHLLGFVQVHVHCISGAIQPSHSLMPSSALRLSQHQGLFQWVVCSQQMTKILKVRLHHQSFQWIFRVALP